MGSTYYPGGKLQKRWMEGCQHLGDKEYKLAESVLKDAMMIEGSIVYKHLTLNALIKLYYKMVFCINSINDWRHHVSLNRHLLRKNQIIFNLQNEWR